MASPPLPTTAHERSAYPPLGAQAGLGERRQASGDTRRTFLAADGTSAAVNTATQVPLRLPLRMSRTGLCSDRSTRSGGALLTAGTTGNGRHDIVHAGWACFPAKRHQLPAEAGCAGRWARSVAIPLLGDFGLQTTSFISVTIHHRAVVLFADRT